MLSRLSDYDRTFDLLDELRRQMDRVWTDFDDTWATPRPSTRALSAATWPRTTVADAGEEIVVTADVPGMTEKELTLTLHDGVLTLAGERRVAAPEGYVVHRQERLAARFSRSFALPAKVDPEKAAAAVKDGVLTVRIAKIAEAKPRQITVKAKG